jgi:hypothetical protein
MSLPRPPYRCIHLFALSLLVAGALGGCVDQPAARSPLREELATPDTPTLERAAITCLEQTGWTVPSVGTDPDGTRVVRALWESEFAGVGVAVTKQGNSAPSYGPSYRFRLQAQQTQLRIHPPGATPRITDGMHNVGLETFWSCMVGALDAPAPEPSDNGNP